MLKYALLAAVIVVWVVVWFAFIRPWLKEYRLTAGVYARVSAFELSAWQKLMIWLEGLKSLIIGGIISIYAAVKDSVDHTVQTVNGLTPTDLDPLKDSGTWHAFFADGVVTKIIAGLAIASGLLALKGRLSAAKLDPQK